MHEVKAAIMLAGPQVAMGPQIGCWASCHNDVRSMPGADPKKKKYVKDANVAGGNYYDYFQWKSGEAGAGATQVDGHVAAERVNKGGQALVKAEGECKAGLCTVTFTRKLSGGEGDLTLVEGQVIPFGIAIHADKTVHRFHHVSLMHQLTIAGKAYASRLLVGTGKYKDFAETRAAIDASGAEIVTVAIRRTNIGQDPASPICSMRCRRRNSPSCPTPPAATRPTTRCARCAWPRTARRPPAVQAGSAGRSDQPVPEHAGNPEGRRNAGQGRFSGHGLLLRRSDPGKMLEEIGCVAVMPLASLIGSGMGISIRGTCA
jgi:hypothetical protein